jgi:N-acetylmuramoyl-L-alanine amidase
LASLSLAPTLKRAACAITLAGCGLTALSPAAFAAAGPLNGKVIVVDPGHGGKDPGSTANGYQEKTVTLAIGAQLGNILQAQGAKVVMTRSADVNPAPNGSVEDDLQARVNLAQQAHADAFVSIHANEAADPNVSGATTFYGPLCGFYSGAKMSVADVGRSFSLAKRVESSVVSRTGERDNGSQDMAFWVLGNPGIPSILVETAFLSNRAEAGKLMDPGYQHLMADAIGDGLAAYFASGDAAGTPTAPSHALSGCSNSPAKQDQPNTVGQPAAPVEQWVQTIAATGLMSGTDSGAKQFGSLAPFTYLKVLGSSGNFLYVLNPATNGPGYVDAKKVGPSGPPPPPFQPTWVESFKGTTLWSGDGPGAVSFGPLPAWSFLQVLAPSTTSRLFVKVDATGNVAYVDRADVGPSGPPPSKPAAPAPAPAPAPAAAAPDRTSPPAAPAATPAPAAKPAATTTTASGSTVVVAPGDTVFAISTRTGASVAEVISANNLSADGDIQVGQKLIIPSGGTTPAAAAAPAPAPKPAAPAAATTVTVAAGDTLTSIASRFSTSVDSLVKLNNLDSPDSLQAGQTLKVAAA